MKKKQQTIIGIIVLVAILIVAIPLLLHWPPINENVGGTIGKADKYRDEQMVQKKC
jgi:hypothetical protein